MLEHYHGGYTRGSSYNHRSPFEVLAAEADDCRNMPFRGGVVSCSRGCGEDVSVVCTNYGARRRFYMAFLGIVPYEFRGTVPGYRESATATLVPDPFSTTLAY